jgi:hypothetical protein
MSMEEIFKVSMHEYLQVFQCTTTGKWDWVCSGT